MITFSELSSIAYSLVGSKLNVNYFSLEHNSNFIGVYSPSRDTLSRMTTMIVAERVIGIRHWHCIDHFPMWQEMMPSPGTGYTNRYGPTDKLRCVT